MNCFLGGNYFTNSAESGFSQLKPTIEIEYKKINNKDHALTGTQRLFAS